MNKNTKDVNKNTKEILPMKPVDNVDKSSLPVVINGVELTEKDFRCIAMHLRFFVNSELREEDSPFPCQMCYDTFSEDKCCPAPNYDFQQALGKLDKITGVFI